MLVAAYAAALLFTQITPATGSEDGSRTALAAERAAAAAEKSAAAAERAAIAVERWQSGVPVAAAAPSASMAGKAKGWTGAAGLSLISLSGNASALTFSATAAAQRKFEVWAVSFKAFGTYGQARVTGLTDAQVVAMAAGGQLRGDRNLTEKVTLFALTGAETNHVKSIEWMAYGEVGTGITWIDVKEGELQKTLLRTDLGLRYSREYQFQYYPTQEPLPSREIIGPRVALAFRHALTKEIIFNQDAEILPNLAGESRFLLNTSTRLSSRLTESLSLGVAFVINHDSRPAPGKLPTDTALTVGVEMAL